MRVLVTYATKYGATAEIAAEVGKALSGAGNEVEVMPLDKVMTAEDYDAVILGSGVYAGHWLKAATRFVKDNETVLSTRPVWLFASGPLGDPPKPAQEAVELAQFGEAIGARGHRTFAGKMEKNDLSFVEKAVVAAVRGEYGDFRDWGSVLEWAAQIADELSRSQSAPRVQAAGK
jgi:menaquinone-dependent protoporphyrinogen oxidase